MPIAKNPGKKDSVRRAQNKYFKENFRTVGCKLPKDLANDFKDKAKANGTTINAVLFEMITKYMES